MQLAALIVVVLLSGGGESSPDLMDIGLCASKGRIQDKEYNPDLEVVDRLVEMGTDAIPFLISRLASDRSYEKSPICFWPDVREGDVALMILIDLFTDDSWIRASHPRVCIESNFGADFDPEEPLFYEMPRYVAEHGRTSIVENWTVFWETHREAIVWDEQRRFFRVVGFEPEPCSQKPDAAAPEGASKLLASIQKPGREDSMPATAEAPSAGVLIEETDSGSFYNWTFGDCRISLEIGAPDTVNAGIISVDRSELCKQHYESPTLVCCSGRGLCR